MSLNLEIKDVGQEQWHEKVSQFIDLNLIQLWEYGEAKSRVDDWKVVRHLFTSNNELVGMAQGVIKKVSLLERGIVWINRAPLWNRRGVKNDIFLLEEMLIKLKNYWVDKEKMYLRIAPPLLDDDRDRNLAIQCGYSSVPSSNWISVKIDLDKSEEELRKGLKQKWRNCLNKAEKLGLTYEIGNSEFFTEKLIRDYIKLLSNKSYKTPITPEFIRALQGILPEDRKMMVLSAKQDNNSLGSILITNYSDSAEYLVGAVNDIGRKLNAGQFLLWNAVCQMKRRGFRWFDLGGANPHSTPKGILHFKQGLSGEQYSLIGEFESAEGIVAKIFKQIIKYAV